MRIARFIIVFGIAAALFSSGQLRAGSGVVAGFGSDIGQLLDTYCFKCHGDTKAKGGVNLRKAGDLPALYRDFGTWEKALQQLRERQMPPEGKPQPSGEQYQHLVEWLQATLDNPDPQFLPRDPGRTVIHRLSRTEYNNTIRDLLGVNSQPADRFPADGGGGGGFDNNADTLFVPPILMESYLAAAEELIEATQPKRLLVTRRTWFVSEREVARRNLERFLLRAFRRPGAPDELSRLVGVYDSARSRGRDFTSAFKSACKAVLVSPQFLFRIEFEPGFAEPHQVTDHQLASRLSYFLWSSMPDDELFRLAAAGRLTEPATLEAQVGRMLRDPKAKALSENFAGQWLGVRNLLQVSIPDPGKFPGYTPAVRDAMMREPVEFFHALLQDNSSLLNLLDSDHTFVNEALAGHYGLTGVTGEELRRVPLPDRQRGGLTGMGAILVQSSYPLRTSPVLRGKYILEEILGTPPPPPPPLIKTLSQDDHKSDGQTFRQRLERHRKDPNCAACHSRMDPLGFALENFDVTGRWRDQLDGTPIDASGQLPGGSRISGPVELKTALLQRKSLFIRHVTEKMLAYALGRGLEYYDIPAVKQITAAVEAGECRATTLITGIVQSYPFQFRRGLPADEKPLAAAK